MIVRADVWKGRLNPGWYASVYEDEGSYSHLASNFFDTHAEAVAWAHAEVAARNPGLG